MVNMWKGGKRKKNDCSRGRRTVDTEDRISSLPDSLLQHIMRFLGIVSVIRTSLLSRRWRHLWKSAPFLDFDYDFDYLSSDIVAVINGSLMLYEGRKIGRLYVDARDESKLDPCTVDPWIRFAARHDVEELDMQFFHHNYAPDKMFKLPRCVLDCGALRVLELRYCVLNFPLSFNLSSLTEIHLYGVQLTHLDASGCPLLEMLIVQYCHSNLDVCAPSQKLRYMMLEDGDQTFETVYGPSGLTLDAPNLLLIEFTGQLKRFYNLKNLSSLQTATFVLYDYYEDGGNGHNSVTLVELLKQVSHAKTVKLCYNCIEMLEGNFEIPTLGATSLDLEADLNCHIPLLTSILQSSPCLETLIIKICWEDEEVQNSMDKIALWDLEHALSNLQINTVVIHDFLKSRFEWFDSEADPSPYKKKFLNKFLKNCLEVKLLKILLKCCKTLNRITIHTIGECSWEPNFFCGLKEKLLALPRRSENVMIDIS